MSDSTRRGFVKGSAATAAGMTVIGSLVGAPAAGAEPTEAEAAAAAGSGPVVAYVSDPASGEIAVMVGDREVSIRNRKLAASIAHAAR